jgi:hypothetical protein
MNILLLFLQLTYVQYGLASVYNDKVYACPKASYKYTHLHTAASRTLECGTIINIKRLDTDKIVKAVISDRGPYGTCNPGKRDTRACGHNSKWKNGRKLIKSKMPIESHNWRGVLDMSRPLARELGVKNRLIPVLIYTDPANDLPSNVDPLDTNETNNAIKINKIDKLASMEIGP